MRKEYKKHLNSKKILRNMVKETKPHMSEKSRHRFQVFKEQIRSELNNNEDYMFSQKYADNNHNTLLQEGKRLDGSIESLGSSVHSPSGAELPKGL